MFVDNVSFHRGICTLGASFYKTNVGLLNFGDCEMALLSQRVSVL